MSQIRKNPAGGLKLRLGVSLAKERRVRTVEVGLHTQDRRTAEIIAATVARILSMTGIGSSVWRLKDEKGDPLDPELVAAIVNASREVPAAELYTTPAPTAPAASASPRKRHPSKKKATQQSTQLCFAFFTSQA